MTQEQFQQYAFEESVLLGWDASPDRRVLHLQADVMRTFLHPTLAGKDPKTVRREDLYVVVHIEFMGSRSAATACLRRSAGAALRRIMGVSTPLQRYCTRNCLGSCSCLATRYLAQPSIVPRPQALRSGTSCASRIILI